MEKFKPRIYVLLILLSVWSAPHTHAGGNFGVIALDESLALNLPTQKWVHGPYKFKQPESILIFQHKKYRELIGNLQSTMKVMDDLHHFVPQQTVKEQCDVFKEYSQENDAENENFESSGLSFKMNVKFITKGALSQCWIEKIYSNNKTSLTVLMASERPATKRNNSYNLHLLSFHFPQTVQANAGKEIIELVGKIRLSKNF